MAKILYAGSASDFVVATTTVLASPSGTVDVLKMNPGASLEAWNAGESGSQITDILLFTGSDTVGSYTTPGGTAPSGVFPAESSSTFLFWAEDTFDDVYVVGAGLGATTAQRWKARPINDTARLIALEALDPIPGATLGQPLGPASLGPDGLINPAELPAGAGAVDSVNGDTGTVLVTTTSIGAVPTARAVATGTGLTGGGDLTTNRTVAVVYGTTAGTVAQGNDARFGTTGTSPRPVYAVVLSNDAPADRKAAAASDPYTWVCDGTNDEVQINLAIDAASPLQSRNAGMPATAKQLGKVVLSGGEFNIGSAGIVMRTAVHLEGAGQASTHLQAASCNQTGLIRLGAATDHLTQLSKFRMDGKSGAGGTCSAIHYNMTGGSTTGGYPDINPDGDHSIHDLVIDEFRGSSRNGIYLQGGSGDHNRGNMIDKIQIRDCTTGHGIWLSGASDSYIMNCHVGGSGGDGYRIQTGNTKISNCKSFYSLGNGFYWSSGRGIVSNCESQDDNIGYYFDASPQTASCLIADSSNVAGIQVSTSELCITGFTILNRGGVGSGIQYETTQRGIYFDATYNDCLLIGSVKAANITTPISGTVPSTNSNVQLLTI